MLPELISSSGGNRGRKPQQISRAFHFESSRFRPLHVDYPGGPDWMTQHQSKEGVIGEVG